MSVGSRHASRFEKKDNSISDQSQTVIAGIDCHNDLDVAAALDPLGRVLGAESFPARCAGYRSTHKWLASFGPVAAVGVVPTGSYGAALARSLTERGCGVIEVNQPHRHLRSSRGKDDATDAEAAARKVLSGEATAAAKDTTGIVESIRQLSVARNGTVKARAAALCQLDGRRTLEGKAAVCARLRPDTRLLADPAQDAKAALRSLGRRIAQLGAEAAELERRLDRLVAVAAPTTLSRLGCGTHHTATLLVAAGENTDRLSSEASFAHLCGAAPVPASPRRTERHRLNFAGNREANRALRMIVIVRLRYCEQTRSYLNRRVAEGKTKKEAIRCLKRYIAPELAPSEPTSPPSQPALHIYRNVPGRFTDQVDQKTGSDHMERQPQQPRAPNPTCLQSGSSPTAAQWHFQKGSPVCPPQ
ncbi:IS110 family transposase [Candidatus Poriferisocius sp.]|uniref:IS110 family transposase n=1 Tax=Candidatus Poriferisocius sp. TaxID=3101276 RepID=UPI003B515FE4